MSRRPSGLWQVRILGVLALVVSAVVTGCTSTQAEPASTGSAPATASPPSAPTPLSRTTADVPLVPGRYVVSVTDAPSAPRVPVLTVPDGYEAVKEGIGVHTDDYGRYVWVWNITKTYSHPCKAGAVAQPVGPSVADLAEALQALPLIGGTLPVPVVVGGYRGLYVTLSVPADFNVAACPTRKMRLWPTRWLSVPGQVAMVWILDVDGQRVIFDASYEARHSPDEVAELKRMVTTATFVSRTGT